MCLDVGDKRIGVAISDEENIIANALLVIERKDDEDVFRQLGSLIKEKEVEKVVVGLPKNLNDTESVQTQKVIKFTDALKKVISLPVHLWDERLSTVFAEKTLKDFKSKKKDKKKVVDKLSASIILQNYLDYLKRAER
jgi:putative Holliday junction resolvase